jgi:hypothetical protein
MGHCGLSAREASLDSSELGAFNAASLRQTRMRRLPRARPGRRVQVPRLLVHELLQRRAPRGAPRGQARARVRGAGRRGACERAEAGGGGRGAGHACVWERLLSRSLAPRQGRRCRCVLVKARSTTSASSTATARVSSKTSPRRCVASARPQSRPTLMRRARLVEPTTSAAACPSILSALCTTIASAPREATLSPWQIWAIATATARASLARSRPRARGCSARGGSAPMQRRPTRFSLPSMLQRRLTFAWRFQRA